MPKRDTKLQKLSETIHITVEELRGLGIEGIDRMFMEEYLMQADQLTDNRQQAKVKHLLKDIVGIVFFAVLAGNDEWTEIADFAVDEMETLEKYLELPNGIPSHDTIHQVLLAKNGVGSLSKHWIKNESQMHYNFTIEVNERFNIFKLPYRMQNGIVLKQGYKTTYGIDKIINYRMFELKIRFSEDMINSHDLMEKKSRFTIYRIPI